MSSKASWGLGLHRTISFKREVKSQEVISSRHFYYTTRGVEMSSKINNLQNSCQDPFSHADQQCVQQFFLFTRRQRNRTCLRHIGHLCGRFTTVVNLLTPMLVTSFLNVLLILPPPWARIGFDNRISPL